ncbi:uncharacterized protein [Haliotis cracherodii]|uniref:uncharacterized protein n=1 Tax=Haliotis cracherodii TaxID=6455 RepID=UPI0039ECE01B
MDIAILYISVMYLAISHTCPQEHEDNLIFDICQTHTEVANVSTSGYLRLRVGSSLLDCNCTLSTPRPDHLHVGLYTDGYFPHSFNLFAGPVNKIAVNAGIVGKGVGSGAVSSTQPWQLNLSRNWHIKQGSQTSQNESLCLGYSVSGVDVSVKCNASFYKHGRTASPVLRKVTLGLAILVPVLLVLLLTVIIISYGVYSRSKSRAEYELKSIPFETQTTSPKNTPSLTRTFKTNPDVCAGHVTDSDSRDGEWEFPKPPPEAYTEAEQWSPENDRNVPT